METYRSDAQRWRAVANREQGADDAFVYAVKTTGVYCRPSCAARLARRENVEFHRTAADAERAGFRACKRCRPNDDLGARMHADEVEKACGLIMNSDKPLGLENLAEAVGMSPSHFHRVFKAVTGLTPRGYATARRSQRVRDELPRGDSVTSAIYKSGFNSNGRFYESSSKLLGMKPADFRAGGKGTVIKFAVGECAFGSILVGTTDIGICWIALGDDPAPLVRDFQVRFSNAELIGGDRQFEKLVARVIAFVEQPGKGVNLPLDIRGTAFQQRVWQALCEIPIGNIRSYSEIAKRLGNPKSTRAVARACAANPMAVAIPCHRVVRTDGSLSGYRWGIQRKEKLLQIEQK